MKIQRRDPIPITWGGPGGTVVGYATVVNNEIMMKIEDESVINVLYPRSLNGFSVSADDVGVHVHIRDERQ